MNKNTEKALESIFNTLTAKSDQEINLLLGETIKSINKSNIKFDNPENFNSFINHKLKRAVELIADNLHEPSVCKDKYKPNFIYANYTFLERHIRELCILREGSSCCADKSRYILKMFLKYSINGEIPNFNPNLEKYYIPNFGDNKMWIEYCDSLYALYYGNTENYFKTYNNLLQCEIRKFKHLLHRWYIEFNDNDIIEIENTWDNNIENPLNDYSDKGEYYIIHKRFTKDREFEIYTPEDEEEDFLFNRHYVKIPKSSIKKIYYETEEKMV